MSTLMHGLIVCCQSSKCKFYMNDVTFTPLTTADQKSYKTITLDGQSIICVQQYLVILNEFTHLI